MSAVAQPAHWLSPQAQPVSAASAVEDATRSALRKHSQGHKVISMMGYLRTPSNKNPE